jgi:hypothetical protein
MNNYEVTQRTECDYDPNCYDYPSYALWEWILGIVLIAVILYLDHQRHK